MARGLEWWQRVVGFPVILLLVLLSLGYQIKLAWERSLPIEHESAVAWNILIEGYESMETGALSHELTSISEQQITLYGFMFPLKSAQTHEHFLLVSHSASCPFHQLLGRGDVVEVHAVKPIRYRRSPILVRGRFIVDDNQQADIQYKLHDAENIIP